MIKCALLLLSCLTIFAQRTPLSVNGTVVNNPNFTNTASVTWSVTGPNIRGTASAGSDSFWTNSSVASGSIQPVGGSNVYMPGTLAVVGQLTNDALQASQLVYSGPDKVLSSISPGNSGDVLTSSGAGIAPSFLPVSGGDTIWTNDNGTISAVSDAGSGTNAFSINASVTHALNGSNIFQIQHGGTNMVWVDATGMTVKNNNLIAGTSFTVVSPLGRFNAGFYNNEDGFAPDLFFYDNTDNKYLMDIWPAAPEDERIFMVDSLVPHPEGNLGELKNKGTNMWTVAAVSGYTGSGTLYLSDDGTYKAVTQPSSSNPSASIGLSTVNGSAGTFMRSDGAPALSQAIAPTWTGAHVFQASSGVPVTITPAANTTARAIIGGSTTGSGTTSGETFAWTLNTSGTVKVKQNVVTDTASGAASFLETWETAAGVKFGIFKDGGLVMPDTTIIYADTAKSSQMVRFGPNITGFREAIGIGTGVTGPSGTDTFIVRDAAATLQFGNDAATATAQTLKGHDGSGTDKDGANLRVQGGQGTGTGRGGALIGRTAPSGSTGSSANAYSERYHFPAKAVTLTSATATTVATIACPVAKFIGGKCIVTVWATDGTDHQARTLDFVFSAINKAGTVTAGIDTPAESVAVSSGSLTVAITVVANGNALDIKVNADSSLTENTLSATVTLPSINSNDTAAVTEI